MVRLVLLMISVALWAAWLCKELIYTVGQLHSMETKKANNNNYYYYKTTIYKAQ